MPQSTRPMAKNPSQAPKAVLIIREISNRISWPQPFIQQTDPARRPAMAMTIKQAREDAREEKKLGDREVHQEAVDDEDDRGRNDDARPCPRPPPVAGREAFVEARS